MRLIASLTILLTSLAVQADILHLRDGSRHYGVLIKQSKSEVVFRVVLADGASAVRRFPVSRVLRLERGGATNPGLSDAEDHGGRREFTREDFAQMLREAWELVDDGDFPAALRALQRMVSGASDEVLAELDRQARSARGRALDEFMAAVRIRRALAGGHGRLLDLRHATRYEARALGVQLAQLQSRLLGTSFHGRTIETWAGQREEYAELRPDARAMVNEARLAAATIGARLRFDPRLKQDRAERRRLVALRDNLARFIAKVSALPGFTAPGVDDPYQDDPTLREARRLAAEQAATSRPAQERPASEIERGAKNHP